MQSNVCCFIGHRTIIETEELKTKLLTTVERLIVEEKVDTFLFGSKSRFNTLCYELVTELKEKYPYIRRVYVRAEFSVIDCSYEQYLLEHYEKSYYPEKVIGAGRAAYVQRNREMIDKSKFCVFYYEEGQAPTARKSGTKLALDYARKKGREIIRLP